MAGRQALAMAVAMVEAFPTLNMLINNAGVPHHLPPLTAPQLWDSHTTEPQGRRGRQCCRANSTPLLWQTSNTDPLHACYMRLSARRRAQTRSGRKRIHTRVQKGKDAHDYQLTFIMACNVAVDYVCSCGTPTRCIEGLSLLVFLSPRCL